MTPAERAEQSRLLQIRVLGALQELFAREPSEAPVLASYLAKADEPDPGVLLWRPALVPNLSEAPVVSGRRAVRWSWLGDHVTLGLHGIPEAVDEQGQPLEALPAEVLSQARVILVPGLAGGRDGSRLGTGGGWYDEALTFAAVGAEVWLLLFDGEMLDTVPTEPHDLPVTRIFTPSDEIVASVSTGGCGLPCG
jgi:5-formyltetrahydrofolate cyclo-ligase